MLFILFKRWCWLNLLLGLILISPGACIADSSSHPERKTLEKVTLQLKWYHQFQFAGYYAAVQKGFYRNEGLDVTLVEGEPSRPALEQVLKHRAEYGITDAEILLARLRGKPVVAMAALFQHSPYILMSRLDRKIHRPQDLIGRRVMIGGEFEDVQFRAMFNRQGIPLSAVKIEPHRWNLDDLIEGRIDAMTAYYTVEPFMMRARKVEPSYLRLMDYGIDFYSDVLFTSEEEIRSHPDRVAAFNRASLKGWRYAMDNPEEIIRLILAMPGVAERGIQADMLRSEANQMQQLILPDLIELGHMSRERWQRIADIYAAQGMVPPKPDISGFLFEVPHLHDRTILRGAAIVCGSLLVLLLLGVLWTLQLHRLVRRRTEELARQNEQLNRKSESLALSEQSYRELFNSANDAILVHDSVTGRVCDVNDRTCELLGLTRNQLIQSDGLRLLCPHDDPQNSVVLQRIHKAATEKPQLYEYEARHSSGQPFWAEVNLKRATINGEERVIALVRNITERKRAEEERLKVSRMDALGVVAGGIAHDVNNLMHGIVLNLDLLTNKAPMPDSKKNTRGFGQKRRLAGQRSRPPHADFLQGW